MSDLSIRGVTVEVDGRRLVDDVSLEVGTGEWLNVIGPNGAGKTTLLRAVAGLMPYRGLITFDGLDARALKGRQRARQVALVPQAPLVPRGMTVAQYVLLGRTAHLRAFAAETAHDLAVAARAIDTLELAGLADRTLETLSGGELQRAVVARMLAQETPIVLLDEPTSALDLGHQQQVLDLVESLRRSLGLTVVATLHDLTLAGQYGDRLALLSGGRVTVAGSAEEVLREDVLAAHYGARLRVLHGDDGPVIIPLREATP